MATNTKGPLHHPFCGGGGFHLPPGPRGVPLRPRGVFQWPRLLPEPLSCFLLSMPLTSTILRRRFPVELTLITFSVCLPVASSLSLTSSPFLTATPIPHQSCNGWPSLWVNFYTHGMSSRQRTVLQKGCSHHGLEHRPGPGPACGRPGSTVRPRSPDVGLPGRKWRVGNLFLLVQV